MPPVRIRPEALDELAEAWLWYEGQREGLGDEFRSCVDVAMAEIAREPLMWPRVRGDVRRRMTRRFPYAVLYLAEDDHIEVLAVFHSSRSPREWKLRVR